MLPKTPILNLSKDNLNIVLDLTGSCFTLYQQLNGRLSLLGSNVGEKIVSFRLIVLLQFSLNIGKISVELRRKIIIFDELL